MLHKKGGKGGQCCRELHQTISLTRNDAPQSLRAGDRERESDTAVTVFLLLPHLEPELHRLCGANHFSTLID